MLTLRTKDLKQGEAKPAWDYMIKMYVGIDTNDKMKFEKLFNESKMAPGTNPNIWITGLERLWQRLLERGKTVANDEFVLNILYKISPRMQKHSRDFLRLIEEG